VVDLDVDLQDVTPENRSHPATFPVEWLARKSDDRPRRSALIDIQLGWFSKEQVTRKAKASEASVGRLPPEALASSSRASIGVKSSFLVFREGKDWGR